MRPALRRMHVAGMAAALLLAAASRASAQEAVLVLRVTASESEAPLQGAQVRVDGRAVAATDAQGQARVAISPVSHQVEVTAIGRHPQTFTASLAAGESQDVEVQLVPSAVPLAPVTATTTPTPARSAAVQAFYDRAANHSNGRFYTREYIEQRRPQQLTDLLLDGTGLKWEYSTGGHRRLRFRRANTASRIGGARTESGQVPNDCPPKWYVNGFPFEMEQVAPRDPSPDLWVHMDEVEGVEVYPDLPPIQYGGLGASCGVILIWLRGDARTPPPAPSPQP
ncbi:MAG TPA: carboxypeptidase-like regulatory domain-containing protein [Longimicrobium sp.]